MAAENRSPREIERELETERAELRGTIDEIWHRLTFEDAWNRVGNYLHENRSEYGHTLGRLVQEKPVAVGLTLIGVTWLLFGPSMKVRSDGGHHAAGSRDPYDDDAVAWAGTSRPETDRRDEWSSPAAARPSGAAATSVSEAPGARMAGPAATSAAGAGGVGAGTARSATSVAEAPRSAPMASPESRPAAVSPGGVGASPKFSDSDGGGASPVKPAGSPSTAAGARPAPTTGAGDSKAAGSSDPDRPSGSAVTDHKTGDARDEEKRDTPSTP